MGQPTENKNKTADSGDVVDAVRQVEEAVVGAGQKIGQELESAGHSLDNLASVEGGVSVNLYGEQVEEIGRKVDRLGEKFEALGQKVDSARTELGQKIDAGFQSLTTVLAQHTEVLTRILEEHRATFGRHDDRISALEEDAAK